MEQFNAENITRETIFLSVNIRCQLRPPFAEHDHSIHGAFLGTLDFVGLYNKVLYATV